MTHSITFKRCAIFRRQKICATGIALGVALTFADAAACAEPLDRFAFRTGGFVTRFDTTIRADGASGVPGTTIDFDRELGLQDHDVIEFIGLEWRPWNRHELGLNYFHESLAGTRRLQRDVVFDGETFELATTVHSRLELEAFEFHYTYWPLIRERWALGLRLGYMDYRVLTEIELLLSEQGEPPGARVSARSVEDIPAPSIGIDVRVVPAANWRISANAGWFEAEFENLSPRIVTARVGLEYFPWENVGFWTDFGINRLYADIHSSSFQGALEIVEGGLRLGVTWRL